MKTSDILADTITDLFLYYGQKWQKKNWHLAIYTVK